MVVPSWVEVLLPRVDGLVARSPDVLGDEVVHPHHQHVLVVRPVEDPDLAA